MHAKNYYPAKSIIEGTDKSDEAFVVWVIFGEWKLVFVVLLIGLLILENSFVRI
jgi:hypothetical protein